MEGRVSIRLKRKKAKKKKKEGVSQLQKKKPTLNPR